MSKISQILIVIMLAALGYMGAVRAYQFYMHKVQLQQEQVEEVSSPFVRLAEDDPRPMPIQWQPPTEDVFIEEKPLSAVLEGQQSKETIESILNDYRMNPAFRKFNEDLKNATQGNIQSFDELSNQSLAQIVVQHPEVNEVIRKNLQSEDFAQMIKQVFSNPQFQQSVKQLQGGGAVSSNTDE